MKRSLILWVGLLALVCGQQAAAQPWMRSFGEIDTRVQRIPATTPDSLAYQLTHPYNTELEKVRSIFRWITEHISYRTRPTYFSPATVRKNRSWLDDPAWADRPGDELTALQVLERGAAVCEGYARLFKTLCTYAGIRSEVVSGYVRNGSNRGGNRFRSNHSWNAVRIDSTWYLLDATWASGFISYQGDVFVKHYDDSYFLALPERLIRTHYPEDLEWSLLAQPPTLREYNQSPFRHKSFIKYQIAAFQPQSGLLRASLGDTLRLEVQTADAERDRRIAPDPYFDSSLLTRSPAWVFLQPDDTARTTRVRYTYPVTSPGVEWVYLMYNNDVVLRYRLAIRKEEEGR